MKEHSEMNTNNSEPKKLKHEETILNIVNKRNSKCIKSVFSSGYKNTRRCYKKFYGQSDLEVIKNSKITSDKYINI